MPLLLPDRDQIVTNLAERFGRFFDHRTSPAPAPTDPLPMIPSSTNGLFFGIWADLLLEAYMELGEAFSGSQFLEATGQDLNFLISLSGIIRRQQSVRFTGVTLTGVSGQVIPVGSVAATSISTGGYHFYLEQAVTIGMDGTGSGNFFQDPNITIPRVFEAGDLNRVISLVEHSDGAGAQVWTGVNNASASVTGMDIESDNDMRVRHPRFISRFTSGTVNSLSASVNSTPSCIQARVYEFLEDSDIVPPGQPMNSVFVIGLWRSNLINDEPLQRVIAQSILDFLPPVRTWNGEAVGGNVGENQFSVKLTNSLDQEIEIGFATAKALSVGVWIQLEFTQNIVETRRRILRFLLEFFNNPTANSDSPNGGFSRGRPIGGFILFQEFQCQIRNLGADGQFTLAQVEEETDPPVLGVWLSSNFIGPNTTYAQSTLEPSQDEILNFTNLTINNVEQLTISFTTPT